MHNADQLLLLASFFEKRATILIKRAESSMPSVGIALSGLIGDVFSSEDIKAWINKNRSSFAAPIPKMSEDLNWMGLPAALDGQKYIRAFVYRTDDNDRGTFAFIGKSSKPPPLLDVQHSALLQGEASIPNLYLFIGKIVPAETIPEVSKELAHENWLITSLTSLLETYPSSSFLNEMSKFVQDNKSKIDKLRKHFSGTPKVLGKGADGVAMSINSHLVLKLFKDQSSYIQATKAIERLHKNPELAKTEAMIYDAGILGQIINQTIYYYLIEKMTPVEKLDKPVSRALETVVFSMRDYIRDNRTTWRKLRPLLDDITKHVELKKEVSIGAKNLVGNEKAFHNDEIKIIEGNLTGMIRSNWLDSLAEELIMKYLTGRDDLHMGNIGFTGYGEFRYFDPVYGPHRSYN